MFISWVLDITLVYLNDRLIVKSNEVGRMINLISYGLLGIIIIGMLFLFFHSFLQYFLGEATIVGIILALVGIIGISLAGMWLSYLNVKNLDNQEVWKLE